MLQHSIAVRFVELVREGNNADLGHITRVVGEAIALIRCKNECDGEKKPEPKPAPDNVNEDNWWQQLKQFIPTKPWQLPFIG